MIPLYNPALLNLYVFDIQNFSYTEGIMLLAILASLILYMLLEKIILPRHYLKLQAQQAKDDVQKAILTREYIEKCEKII